LGVSRTLEALGGLTKPGRSQRRDQMKPSTCVPPGWGLGVRLTTPPQKYKPVTETTTTITTITSDLIVDWSQTSAWVDVQAAARKRTLWRNIVVVALCPTWGGKEDKKKGQNK